MIQITWRRTKNKSNQTKHFSNVVDYILVYSKFKESLSTSKIGSENTGYNYEDEKGKYSRNTILDKKRGQQKYSVVTPKGQKLNGPWVIREGEFQKLREANLVHWSDGKNETPYKKVYLEDTGGLSSPDNFWDSKTFGSNQDGSFETEKIFGNKTTFDFPKPVKLLKTLLKIGIRSSSTDLFLDFFAGSATAAQAVLELNREDDGNRKFILVQLPEPIENKGLSTIAEIGKERIRRVIKTMNNEREREREREREENTTRQARRFRLQGFQTARVQLQAVG